jgi:hypothetical protein
MRKALAMVTGLAIVLAFVVGVQADDKKEETLKGTLVCGKCTLKEADACTNVLQVKKGDKTVNYYIKDMGNKEAYHKKSCPAGSKQEATVTGTVSMKDGKMWITASKVEVK